MTPLVNFNFDTYPCNNVGLPNTQSFKCRVKRHLISTSNQKHGRPAETKPDSTIFTQRVKMNGILLDPKLYSKALRIGMLLDPNLIQKF